MKKILLGLTLLGSMNVFASGVIADLQFVCERTNVEENKDISTLNIYNASTTFNKKKVIVGSGRFLIEGKFKKVSKGIVVTYKDLYEDADKLTIGYDGNSSVLKTGTRTIVMTCENL